MDETKEVLIEGNISQYVKLNVGGLLFFTTIGTLVNRDTMLSAMFSGRMKVRADPEGWILIDRSGKHFNDILNYLRDGNINLPTVSKDLADLMAEAKYYCIPEIEEKCKEALEQCEMEYNDFSRIFIIKTPAEYSRVTSSFRKPKVILSLSAPHKRVLEEFGSRICKKSYENIMKNVEYFEAMSLRFKNRAVFVKFVKGRTIDFVCDWEFMDKNGSSNVSCSREFNDRINVTFPKGRIMKELMEIYSNTDGSTDEIEDPESTTTTDDDDE